MTNATCGSTYQLRVMDLAFITILRGLVLKTHLQSQRVQSQLVDLMKGRKTDIRLLSFIQLWHHWSSFNFKLKLAESFITFVIDSRSVNFMEELTYVEQLCFFLRLNHNNLYTHQVTFSKYFKIYFQLCVINLPKETRKEYVEVYFILNK